MELANYLESLGTASDAIFAVAGFLATAYLLGRVLLARMTLPAHESFFLSIALGIDVLILLAMPWLWLGMLPNLLLKIVFGGSIAMLGFILLRSGRSLIRQRPGIPWHLSPFVALGLILWPNALSYPYSWDDLTYQIAVPLRWLRANSLEVFLDNPFSAFPGANLIGNLLLFKAGGLLAPLLFQYALGLILALAIHFLLRERLGPWPATILSLSLVLSLSFLMVTTSAYAEPMILLQFVASLFVVKREGIGPWLLMGIFCGFAAAVKLTGGILAVAIGLFFVHRAWHERARFRPERLAGRGVAFFGPLLLIAVCFYSRAWLATGDPLYPYLAGAFTDREAALATSEYHHDAGRLHFGTTLDGPAQAAKAYLSTPALLALGPIIETNYDGYFGLQCLIHVVLIGSVFLARFGRDQSRERDPLFYVYLGFALLLYTFWFFTAQQSRFLLPAFLCVVLASSCARWIFSGRRGCIIMALLLIVTVGSLPPRLLKQVVYGWGNLWTGTYRPIDYLVAATGDDYLSACFQIRERTAPDAKIMLLYEQRGLYIPRPYVIGTPYFQERFYTPPDAIASDDDFMNALFQAKISHLLVAFQTNDPDRMQKYMDLGQPFQERIRRLSVQGRLTTLWPDVSKVKNVNYALYAVEAGTRARSAAGIE